MLPHALVLLAVALGPLLLPAPVAAAEDTPRASRSTFAELIAVQELWEEERWDDAIARLEKLRDKVREAPYDYAVTNQYLAHTSYLAGQTGRTRQALEAALATPGLPSQLVLELKLFYGQIMLAEEEFDIARRMFDDWLAGIEEEPQPTHLFSAAYANYRTDNLSQAERLVARAIDAEPEPQDNWYRLQYQVLFELGKYDQAEKVLLGLVSREPSDPLRWSLLSNHYLRQEDSARALAVMLLSRHQGLLKDPSDFERIVQLYSFLAVPERAARMLEEWMNEGAIEESPQTLRQLGDLWLLARERSDAQRVLQKAAAVAPDGRTWELLGGVYFEEEQWEEAHEAFNRALDAGGLEERDRVTLLAGLSAWRAGMNEAARSALREAAEAKSQSIRGQARALLKRIDQG